MGLCQIKDLPDDGMPRDGRDQKETQKNDLLNAELKEDWKQETKVKKLLLLGTGESGKSTLFKQAKAIYGTGFSEKELLDFVNTITDNIIGSMKTLIFESQERNKVLNDVAQAAAEEILNVNERDLQGIHAGLGTCIEILWADPNIQDTFAHRAEFQLFDSIRYFAGEIKRIARPNYVPSLQDVLMARRVTLGVTELSVSIKGSNLLLKFIDVGGQRSQRHKWLHQFNKCDAIIYVVAINEYDQTLYEDRAANRLLESLALFEVLCSNKDLSSVSLILFLNKRDLFEEKLLNQNVPLTICFPEYQGGTNYDAAIDFLEKKFESKNTNLFRDMFVHTTCATDTNQAQFVLDVLTKKLIDKLMASDGFL